MPVSKHARMKRKMHPKTITNVLDTKNVVSFLFIISPLQAGLGDLDLSIVSGSNVYSLPCIGVLRGQALLQDAE
jgi:hypothetical protein